MIRFYEGEDGKILVSIAGENFSQLLHVCKDHGASSITLPMTEMAILCLRFGNLNLS